MHQFSCKTDCFRATVLLSRNYFLDIFSRKWVEVQVVFAYMCKIYKQAIIKEHLFVAVAVFISVFFGYFATWFFKYLIIGIKGHLQKMKLFSLWILSHVEIPMNEKWPFWLINLDLFQHHFLRNWIFASLLRRKKESRDKVYFFSRWNAVYLDELFNKLRPTFKF